MVCFVAVLEQLTRALLVRSKRLTRKGLYPFLEHAVTDACGAHRVTRILNIGAGGEVGTLVANTCRANGAHLFTIDLDPARCPGMVGSAEALPFRDRSFNCVVCAEVLEHVERPAEAIREIHRVLVPGGVLALTTRFIFPLHDRPQDYFRYTKYGLALLLKPFSRREIRDQHGWIETLSVLLVRGLKEDHRWARILSLPLFGVATALSGVANVLGDRLASDHMPSGYFVIAMK
jgi:SAM-dependent methyltransferase